MRFILTVSLILTLSLAAYVHAEPPTYHGRSVEQWTADLAHPHTPVRLSAAKALVKFDSGAEIAVGPLLDVLEDENADVRLYAAYALGMIKRQPEQCLPALTKLLSDPDEHVRYSAEWSLAQIAIAVAKERAPEVDLQRLDELLAAAQTVLRERAVTPAHVGQLEQAREQLQAAGMKVAAPELPPQVPAAEEIVRLQAALNSTDRVAQLRAIERLKALKRADELVHAWENLDAPGFIEWHVSRALVELGEAAVPELTRALRHEDEQIRWQAGLCLEQIGPAAIGALPELLALFADDQTSDQQRETTPAVIASMGPLAKDATDTLVGLLRQDESEETHLGCMRALAAIGPDAQQASVVLLDILRNGDLSGTLRLTAAQALSKVAPDAEPALQVLSQLLEENGDEDDISIADLAATISAFGPRAASLAPKLIPWLDETTDFERVPVVHALREIGPSAAEAATAKLIERLTDPDEIESVQVATAMTLAQFGPPAVQMLGAELERPTSTARPTVVRALVEIGAQAAPAYEQLLQRVVDLDEETEVRALAAVALGQVGPPARAAAEPLAAVIADAETPVYLRCMAAVALGQIDPAAGPRLAPLLNDADPEVRVAAAYALRKMEPATNSDAWTTLVEALDDELLRERAQRALRELGAGSLPLLVAVMQDQTKSEEARLACLEVCPACGDAAVEYLLQALNDEVLKQSAYWSLRDLGNGVIPRLLSVAEDQDRYSEHVRLAAANLLVEFTDGFGAGPEDYAWTGGHALMERESFAIQSEPDMSDGAGGASAMLMSEAPESPGAVASPAKAAHPVEPSPESYATEMDTTSEEPATGYKSVKVFYGTNREPIDDSISTHWPWYYRVVVVAALAGMAFYVFTSYRRGKMRRAILGVVAVALLCGLSASYVAGGRKLSRTLDKPGPTYGTAYSEQVALGYCEVTIPATHQDGQLEAPTLLRLQVREDLHKHVVLTGVFPLEKGLFFDDLRAELGHRGNSILVFVHGYNVSFEDAARRTAQMANDLDFAGAPLFYSWPSQANWRKYRVDEKNVELSVDQLKGFLLDVAQQSGADTINLIAHSMGNRALTSALKEIDVAASGEQQLFNQVVLAAPDIDADIFKQRIAPAITSKARHVTLYASANDLALVASREFNSGDPRAGDAGNDLVVVPGIDTIDVSAGDSSLLGHSYYGESASVLGDIARLLHDQPPAARGYLQPVSRAQLTYWIFQPAVVALDDNDANVIR